MTQVYRGKPTCTVVYCKVCGKVVDKSKRGQSRTCSNFCFEVNEKEVRKTTDARKLQRNSNLYKENNQRHKAKVDADPALRAAYLEKEKQRYEQRRNDGSYKSSIKTARSKYSVKHKDRIDAYRKRYREKIGDETFFDQKNIAEINRSEKRSEALMLMKETDPVAYEKYRAERRDYEQKYKSRKRLAQMQKDFEKMVNTDE